MQVYITSLASNAHKIGSAIRQHWGIENSVHWKLDVTFNEDECRIRSLHSPQNSSKATSHCPECLRARIIFPPQHSPKVSASRDERSVYGFCFGGGSPKLNTGARIHLSIGFETR